MLVQYLAKRVLWSAFVLLGVLTITFLLTRMVPGDPVRFAVGMEATQAQVDRYRESLGLDRPLPEQYIRYVGNALKGDLGQSVSTRRPVSSDIARYFPATFELVFYAMFLVIIGSIVLGVLSGSRANSRLDGTILFISTLGMALPVFWFALMLQLLFYGRWNLLPVGGRGSHVFESVTGLLTVDAILAGDMGAFINAVSHLVLPVLALAIPRLGVLTRLTRGAMLDVLRNDYIRTARSQSLSERVVLYKYALKNALIPVISYAGLQFGWLMGATVIVESVFLWPGIGLYAVDGIVRLDYPAIIASALVISLFFVVVNLITDVLYVVIDPRIRL